MNIKRRDFLAFIGRSAILSAALGPIELLASEVKNNKLPFIPLKPSTKDQFELADGFSYNILIKWGDVINMKGEKFGFNNDFIALNPINKSSTEAIMWVNHEYHNSLILYGLEAENTFDVKTKENVKFERKSVGGSLLHIKYKNNKWQIQKNSKYNKRVDGFTPIKFSNKSRIFNSSKAIGTLGNCAGGVTPWGTVLSCEENYQNFVGEVSFDENGKRTKKKSNDYLTWDGVIDLPPEHYGWVVEINPKTASAVKQVALGRFCHEGATCVKASDGRVVVYMGDDANNEHFYKFISEKPNSLTSGTLYVASLEKGEWLPLDIKLNSELKEKFKTQLQMLIQTREAAKIVGASPLDRPEDCEIDPITKAIYLNCTNNKKQNRPHGSILKFVENNNDHLSLKFTYSVFINGGEDSGISCPDNMVFDKKGNLWVTSDISDEYVNKGEYSFHGNNALYYIPMSGSNAGIASRVANAPIEAELTGPCFSQDGKTLFLSVQHPGGASRSLKNLTSHWPDGGGSLPKPSVVAIKLPDSIL